ncbi:MAG: YncE family protein [Gammaproteobacteria bacterium]
MKILLPSILFAAVLPLSTFAVSAQLAPQKVIKIPGGEHGIGFDDIGYAAPLHSVMIPAGDTGNLVMIDPVTNTLTVIPGVATALVNTKQRREGTSSAVYADGYLFASDHDPSEVVVINPRTGKVAGRFKLESGPDYVRYVARTHEIWVTEPGKQQIQVFKLAVNSKPMLTPKTAIHIAGGPESLEIDNRRNRAYSNLWKSKTVEMDLSTHKVLAEWPNTCKSSHGIAIDEVDDHVFVACGEGKVVTLAPDDQGKVLTSILAGAGIDSISYSPILHHLYVPGARAGTLTIFNVASSGILTSLAVYKTAERAHCVTDDNDGHVFVCDPRAGTILKIDDR